MAKCYVCNVEFDIGSMGPSVVQNYDKREKCKNLIQRQLDVEYSSVPSVPNMDILIKSQ